MTNMHTTAGNSINNTKQLFATHSLADLAAIAAKLRADVAKRDSQLATALADEYPRLHSACNTLLDIKQSTLALCDATVALSSSSTQADTVPRLRPPPAIPHSHSISRSHSAATKDASSSWVHDLDRAWSNLCAGDYVSAIPILSKATLPPPTSTHHTPPLCQTTLSHTRSLVAVDFVRHAAASALARARNINDHDCDDNLRLIPNLQAEYALVQEYTGLANLAHTFLGRHHSAILDSLVPANPNSVQQAVRAAIHVHLACLSQLQLPSDHVETWARELQSALADWIQSHRTGPPVSVVDQALKAFRPTVSPPSSTASHMQAVSQSWTRWLAQVQQALQQDAVHSVLAQVRQAITQHVAADADPVAQIWVTGGSPAGTRDEYGAPPKDLAPLHAQVQALVTELCTSSAGGGAYEFFDQQVDQVLGDLTSHDAPIDKTVRSLIAAGHVLGTWPKIHAHMTPVLDTWTRAWCAKHAAPLLDQPCAEGDLPTPGLIQALFALLSEVQSRGLLPYSVVTKHILRTTATWLAAHYASRPLTAVPADVVLADMALVDRVCGTSERDQVATALDINGPAHDATRAAASALASAAMQSWGILLQSAMVDPPLAAVAASAPAMDLPPGFSLDPIDRMGPLLPPVPVAVVGPPALSIVTTSTSAAAASTMSARPGLLVPLDPSASDIQSPLKHSPLPNGGHLLFGARAAQFWTHTRHQLFGAAVGSPAGTAQRAEPAGQTKPGGV